MMYFRCYYIHHFSYSVCFFFFKQKTAYEMRISDWSSDVCSSDLLKTPRRARALPIDRGDKPDQRDRRDRHMLAERGHEEAEEGDARDRERDVRGPHRHPIGPAAHKAGEAPEREFHETGRPADRQSVV